MFCFPNSFGRRDRSGAPSPTSPLSPSIRICPIASVESMTDDEPTSPTLNNGSSSPRIGRWKKRTSTAKHSDTSTGSSSSSANNSRSSSGNREQHQQQRQPGTVVVTINHIASTQSSSHHLNSQLSIDGSSSDTTNTWPTPTLDSLTPSRSPVRQHSVDSSSSGGGMVQLDVLVPQASPTSPSSPTSVQQQQQQHSANGSMHTHTTTSPGARFKLVHEGDIQVCYLNHTRTVVSKILSSKFLRRWETHKLYLNDSAISSKTPTGFLESSVSYSRIEEVYVVTRWDVGHKFCIRIVVADGSLLLQANNSYTRDQWFHSILWKKNMFKYHNILKPSTRPEVILKELKNLVEYANTTPLQDECVVNEAIETVSNLLTDEATWSSRTSSEDLISTLSPLLDNYTPSSEMCRFFSQHCSMHPRSPVVAEIFTPIIHRILKHNVDFGKSPNMRRFVQDYIQAIYLQNAGEEVIKAFVTNVHGPSSGCPHPRVLPNLVSVCLAAVFSNFEDRRLAAASNKSPSDEQTSDDDKVVDIHGEQLKCHIAVFLNISEYDDWRIGLAQFLHPLPFPDDALAHEPFLKNFMPVIQSIASDPRCDVHQMVLGIREGKEGWFHVYCPSSVGCADDGQLWCIMVKMLLECCCRRKRFLSQLTKQLGTCLLLALRDFSAAQEALCLMLEWQLIDQEDQKLQLVTTLQSTKSGQQLYSALCDRQLHLKELQQKGGPRKLTLPSRSTDDDIARLLSCGSFGNLECLSLAFTHVTSACAEQLIKLPALRYLNLWATQFGDAGLLLISEHLPKLQVLNLCETPVSDKGIAALSSMTNLCKLNLNSTKLTASTFENLKKKLPGLQEFDVRYTEAW